MRLVTITAAAVLLALAIHAVLPAPAAAQMGRGWGERERIGGWRDAPSARRDTRERRSEARVAAEHFAADDAAAKLGQGTITVASLPDSTPESRTLLSYEAATIDRLVLAGYNTLTPTQASPQVAEIRVRQFEAEPAEARRNPVSGEGSVTVSNRGTAVGMAVAVDFTEPRGALIATHMDLRIKDRSTGTVLWEARARITTEQGDTAWTDDRLAATLAAALFEGFPRAG